LETDVKRRLIFQIGETRHEIDAGPVLEVVKLSHITRVPHGPQALKGIANLRGRPIPVLSVGKALNGREDDDRGDGKIIVYDHGGAVGLLVDDVLGLSEAATETPLLGVNDLLEAAFTAGRRTPVGQNIHFDRTSAGPTAVTLRPLLSFRVAGQLYGLPLEHVREIAAFASDVAIVANAGDAVIGVIPIRDTIVPLMSLASLLGLDADRTAERTSRVIVVEYQGDLIGLVVDEMDIIHRIPEQSIDPVPALLQRGRGDAQIEAIGRISQGGLLISILSPEKLFGHGAVSQVVSQNRGAREMQALPDKEQLLEQVLIFRLGEEHYGLPIGSVDEVVRVPNDVTRIPGAPAFVTGVINLRGKPVPLIDQRSRFQTPQSTQTAKARAIIVTLGTLKAGFVVDAVTELLAVPSADLSAAPEFSSEQTGVFDRIAHIEADGRMILLIDPQELLTRAERDVVAFVTAQKMDGS
jgi:purine-binding chemotaxis protein CheW